MSHEVHPDMSEYHVRIYEAIREYVWYGIGQDPNNRTDPDAPGLGPSKQELQRACRCSSTTVNQAFAELRRRGLIIAPKHSVRSARPTDLERTISKEPLDPWAEISEDDGKPKFWKLPE